MGHLALATGSVTRDVDGVSLRGFVLELFPQIEVLGILTHFLPTTLSRSGWETRLLQEGMADSVCISCVPVPTPRGMSPRGRGAGVSPP